MENHYAISLSDSSVIFNSDAITDVNLTNRVRSFKTAQFPTLFEHGNNSVFIFMSDPMYR